MGKKYYRLVFVLVLIIVCASGYYLWQEQVIARRPFSDNINISITTEYTICSHDESSETTPKILKVSNLRDLRDRFNAQDGWRSRYQGEQVVVFRKLEELCTKCSEVTHLGEKGGFLAVVRGPAGIDGGIMRVTKIRVDSLPSEMRKEAENGTLDIPDEETLLHILDSLEEHESI